MKEEEKRVVSRVLSLHNPSFFLTSSHLFTVSIVLSIVCTGVGWKCLDFDIFLEDRQSGLPPLQRFQHCSAEGSKPRRYS